jgi:MoaA/NifB/PqqE/SkfB family radical SAM enzyme
MEKCNNVKFPEICFYTWDIQYECNYRCSYCFFNDNWEADKKKNRFPGIDKLKEQWDDIYKKYGTGHIHITGGEPFAYPDFMELVEHLIRDFTVEFDTNLSFDADKFMARIGPDKVKFAASFHPQFTDVDTFLNKALALKKAGYDIGVNYVAFPEQIQRMKEYKDRFAAVSIAFNVMPFRGKYKNMEYPDAYSEDERKLICECDPRTGGGMMKAYSSDKNGDKKEPPKPANPHLGKPCRMGQMYTKIHPNGNAFRCCLAKEDGLLGNIIDNTFKFYEEAKPCAHDKCPCWVAMIVNEEQNWSFHWVTPSKPKV